MALSPKPKSIQSVLEQTFKQLGFEKKMGQYSLWKHWPRLVGERVAQQAKPERMQGNILVVAVSSSAWLQELTLMKPLLLQKIKTEFSEIEIEGLRFELAKKTGRGI